MCNGLMYSAEAAVPVPVEQFYGISEARILWLTVRPCPRSATSALGSLGSRSDCPSLTPLLCPHGRPPALSTLCTARRRS